MTRDPAAHLPGHPEIPSDDRWGQFLFAGALAVACVFLAMATRSTLGLWDEVYYANWIDTPNAYAALVQPFGLFLHPIYVLFARSLVAIRLVGIALLVVTGIVMGRGIRCYLGTINPALRVPHLPLAAAFASLLYYVLWALTPSYNLLANAGAALVLAGGFGWSARDRGAAGADWHASLCCGLGGAITFLGKPTSAVLAGGLVTLYLLVTARRAPRRTLLRAAVAGAPAALVVLLSIHTAMPLGEFTKRVGAGVAALGADYSTAGLLLETARTILRGPWYLFASGGMLIASIVVARLMVGGRWGRIVLIGLAAALVVVDVVMVAMLFRVGILYAVDPWSIAVGTSVMALVLTTVASGIALTPSAGRDHRMLILLAALIATPYLIAFGTANDLFRQAGMSLFPAMVATVVVARACFPPLLARVAETGWVLLTMGLLGWSALRPYNQPAPIFAATEATAVPFSSTRIRLDPATARYARDLRDLARTAGIDAHTPVLDLSGISPGTVALLGARAPFFPWIIHFSKRPSTMAVAAWQSLTPAEQRRTWIIGPIHPRFAEHPTIAAIARSGRYRKVATLRYAPGAGSPPVMFWAPTGP